MAINDVSLTSGMRNNLLALQGTSKLIQRTQERLASGKQVNSALDNPVNFFAAKAATARASDFNDRKDGMSEAVQQVKAGDSGITAITQLVSAAKGLVQSALSTSNTTTQSNLSVQYDTLRTQIDQLASDASYRGKNLLLSQTVTVSFNEDASSSLNVLGFSGTSTGLSIIATTGSWAASSDLTNASSALDKATSTLRDKSQSLSANLNIITTRQDFTDQMINTLNNGSDHLTLADMNQEGANMLMLNTRQSLGTSSLSMSSQAAQSILKLF